MARPSTSNLRILLRSNGSIENAYFFDEGLLARWRALAFKFLPSIFWGLSLRHLRAKSFKTNFGLKKIHKRDHCESIVKIFLGASGIKVHSFC